MVATPNTDAKNSREMHSQDYVRLCDFRKIESPSGENIITNNPNIKEISRAIW